MGLRIGIDVRYPDSIETVDRAWKGLCARVGYISRMYFSV